MDENRNRYDVLAYIKSRETGSLFAVLERRGKLKVEDGSIQIDGKKPDFNLNFSSLHRDMINHIKQGLVVSGF